MAGRDRLEAVILGLLRRAILDIVGLLLLFIFMGYLTKQAVGVFSETWVNNSVALTTLNTGRITLPAACAGMMARLLDSSLEWSRTREQWGAPIGHHEAIGHKLADSGDVSGLRKWDIRPAIDDSRLVYWLHAGTPKFSSSSNDLRHAGTSINS